VRLGDLAGAVLLGLLAPVAGVGLLYLLRGAHIAGTGSHIRGALPLESLAGDDAQPLARVALAWLPVGLVTGALFAVFTRTPRLLTLVVAMVIAGVVLVVNVGVSISIENNESLTKHLHRGFDVAGPWVSLSLLVIGSSVAELVAWARPSAPSAS
jgi:hypothetical protein